MLMKMHLNKMITEAKMRKNRKKEEHTFGRRIKIKMTI